MGACIKIRKLTIIPTADICDARGRVIGEWNGDPFQVFRGYKLFPELLAVELEKACPEEKINSIIAAKEHDDDSLDRNDSLVSRSRRGNSDVDIPRRRNGRTTHASR